MQANVVFCDDIRTEAGGKQILIGVYPNGLAYSAPFPATITLSIWLHMTDLNSGRHHVVFIMKEPHNQDNLVHFGGNVVVDAPDLPLTIGIGPVQFVTSKPGDVNAYLSIDSGPMTKIGAINIAPPRIPAVPRL